MSTLPPMNDLITVKHARQAARNKARPAQADEVSIVFLANHTIGCLACLLLMLAAVLPRVT